MDVEVVIEAGGDEPEGVLAEFIAEGSKPLREKIDELTKGLNEIRRALRLAPDASCAECLDEIRLMGSQITEFKASVERLQELGKQRAEVNQQAEGLVRSVRVVLHRRRSCGG